MSNRIAMLRDLKYLINEYEELNDELSYMSDAWEGNDPSEAACSDPGLQFEKEEQMNDKYLEIINICKELMEEHNA